MAYLPRRPAQITAVRVRDLQFAVYRWPGTDPDATWLLHGWGDTAATWQFLVDAAPPERSFIAFDQRGFGDTQWPADGYWFADYLADLEALLDRFAPNAAVDLVGHSMGGNVAMLYAGARPQRVRRLASLEGFGLPATTPEQAPGRYAQWLDEIKDGHMFASYERIEQFAQVLARRNPRVPAERIDFIARAWSRVRADGKVELRADPRHKRVNPVLYQREQARACWRAIEAPVLLVIGTASALASRMQDVLEPAALHADLRRLRIMTLEGMGHMLHHEQPETIAALLEDFLRAS